MKKNVIVLLLCISSNGFAMYQPSHTSDENILASIRLNRKKQLPLYYRVTCLPQLVQCVQDNNVEGLRNKLNGVMEKFPSLLSHVSSASVLHEAVKNNRHCCMALLLGCNAHPNTIVNDGNTLLHVARGSTMVQLLVDHGAWVEQKNDKGETPLFALFSNMTTFSLDTAQALCGAGADVNTRDKQNNTPLHCAVEHLGSAEIKFLLHRGAYDDINDQGETAYQIAKKRGWNILKAFQEWEKVSCAINATVQNNPFLTIMSLLAHNGEQLKKLLIRDPIGYCSPDIIIAEKLFQKCDSDVWNELRSDISPYSAEALSLLKLVSERRIHRMSFVKSLRENDFANACDFLKKNPYLLHTYDGEYESDDVNALFINKFISTPFFYTQYCYLREMIHSGFFDVDSCDTSGDPLLIAAVQEPKGGDKYLDLLHAGAYVNITDKGGYTPLLLAVMQEKEDMVLQLLSYGAVVNKDFGWQVVLPDSMRELMVDAYNEQCCFICQTHDYDLVSIPGRGKRFICTHCR